jgi:hypothetical protein
MVEKSISNKEIIVTIILFASTLFIFQSFLLSQSQDNNINNINNAYAQPDLIGTLRGSDTPQSAAL